jgi:hypothetical protein
VASTASQAAQGDGAESLSPEGYSGAQRPLAGYSTLAALFGASFAGSLLLAKRTGHELPERLTPWDLITVGLATHKVSRLISKDKVTSFLRAPFVRFKEESGQGEVSEEPRGEGLQRATGELLGCPYCLGQWVAAGFGAGLVAAPRLTRLVAFIYTAETVADFLQLGYLGAEERASSS